MSQPPLADLAQVPLAKLVRSSALTLLAFLVAGDLLGVLAVFMFDVVPRRSVSSLLFYVIWFVLGVFAGLAAYTQAGSGLARDDRDWATRPGARVASWRILLVFSGVLAVLTALSWALVWSSRDDGVFVPDNAAATVIYFGTVLAAAGFGHHLFHVPAKKKA